MLNGIVKSALRVTAMTSRATSGSLARKASRQPNRNLWSTFQSIESNLAPNNLLRHHKTSKACVCFKEAHTKAEKELVEFLAEEIVAEKKAQKLKTIPTDVDGFKVSLDGAEVSLVKQTGDETIKILFNVNHTVDTDSEPELDPRDEKPDIGDMKSKPNFAIDIMRGNQTLSFSCSFNNEPGASGADDGYNDIFGIDEIALYAGEHTNKTYAVGGEVIDGYLYDLLMNYLEEKGVSNEFTEKLVDLSTSYEHTAYIGLLEGLSKFTAK